MFKKENLKCPDVYIKTVQNCKNIISFQDYCNKYLISIYRFYKLEQIFFP